MPTCPQPQPAILGQFLCGRVNVGQGHTDPQAGIAKADYTILGRWWAYACSAPLQFVGNKPAVVIIGGADVVPPASLLFEGYLPTLRISPDPLQAPAATLRFQTYVPGLRIDCVLVGPTGILHFAVTAPLFAGQVWIFPDVCTDLVLAAAGSSDLALVAVGSSDLDLDVLECR